MNNSTISILRNKTFLNIINETKLFLDFKINFYSNIDLFLNENKKELVIVFENDLNELLLNYVKNFNLPKIVIYSGSSLIIKLCEKSFFPVYLKINEDTTSDPLFQIKKPHISKPQQLENIIKKFRIKNNFYFDSHSKIIKYSTNYFYKINKEKILKVFSK